MPRTKQTNKRSFRENTEECDSLVRDCDRQTAQHIDKWQADLRMQLNAITTSLEVAQSRLPTEIRKLSLRQLLAPDVPDEDDVDDESVVESSPPSPLPTTAKAKKKTKRVTAASDDGYATEGTTRTTHVSRINSTRNSRQARVARSISSTRNSNIRQRAMRSSSRGRSMKPSAQQEQNDRNDLLKSSRCPSIASKFKTPSAKNSATSYAVVTPKVKPNTPLNLLRRPRDGEMVLSMQGSPLLVSSIVQERMANINVPLHNGNVISLLPNAGLRLSNVPDLDAETMKQLKTLKGHIDMVIGSK